MKTVVLFTRVTIPFGQRVQAVGERRGMNISEFIRYCLVYYLDMVEAKSLDSPQMNDGSES